MSRGSSFMGSVVWASVPLGLCLGIVMLSSPLTPGPARRFGLVAAGIAYLYLAVTTALLARDGWGRLCRAGLVEESSLAELSTPRRLAWLMGAILRSVLPVVLPWLALPFVLIGFGGWRAPEVWAWIGLLLVQLSLAIGCGVLGAMGSRSAVRGLILLALATLLPTILTAGARSLIAPRDLWSWLGRSLAMVTPVGVLPMAHADPSAGPAWTLLAIWTGLASVTLWAAALRLSRRSSRWMPGAAS